jgi:UDPglucose 6-dehydrogenase
MPQPPEVPEGPVAVIGAGHVGLVTAAGFAHHGRRVRVGEADPKRLAALQDGILPFSEPGLADIVAGAVDQGNLTFHGDNAEAASGAVAVFVAVPTPPGPGGAADLSLVEAAIRSIAGVVSPPTPVVVKSSVPPGSWEGIAEILTDVGSRCPLVINPEFLQEGRAVADVMEPARVVVGSTDPDAVRLVAALHEPFGAPVVCTDPASAELAKYAANSYLATRLSFANALAQTAEAFGADVEDVLEAVGLDPRIGHHYFRPGPGYGGSCFPKDLPALVAAASERGLDLALIRSVVDTNDAQVEWVTAKVLDALAETGGSTVGLLGLAFKGGTDDSRISPAVALAERIVAHGARVRAYDPAAVVIMDGVEQVDDPLEAARDADVVLVATEWEEFVAIDPSDLAEAMRGNVIVDARNLLDPEAIRAAGLEYRGLGR